MTARPAGRQATSPVTSPAGGADGARPAASGSAGGAGTAAVAPAAECVACGQALHGPWCHACGQRAPRGRLTLRRVVAGIWQGVTDADRGLLVTVRDLALRPAAVVADWWAGRTVRRANPAKVFILAVAAAQAGVLLTGFMEGMTAGMLEAADNEEASLRFLAALENAPALLFGLGVPFQAAWNRLLFRAAGRTFAEHLVFALYVTGFTTVLFLGMLVVGELAGSVGGGVVLAIWTVLVVGYPIWAAMGAFHAPGWRGALRGGVAVTLAALTYTVAVALASSAPGWS